MQKIAEKNKMFFYLATAITALFLAVNVMPQANAEGLGDDIMAPDDVENLQIELYDGAALLSWDVATDDTGVIGYKIYSGPEAVTAETGEYSNDVIDTEDVIEYLIEGLTNEEEIYFAITAYDAAGNESESYSNEVYGTPDAAYGPAPSTEHAAADEEGPTVQDSQASDAATVEVIFNEPIVLPASSPETAFNIVNNATGESLTILAAELDEDDTYGATIILITDPQEAGAEYILTAGIEIQDIGGNPIVSGTSDTAAFIGSDVAPGENPDDLPNDDLESPIVVSAEALSETEVAIEFSEGIILDSDPETNFYIAAVSDATNTLDIIAVERDETGSIITITTSQQSEVTYSIIVSDVMDEAGNQIDDTANTANFEGYITEAPAPAELPDEGGLALSPENVRNFIATIVRDVVINLTWTPSDDASIIEQILYQSTDGGTNYDDGRSLAADRDEIELSGLIPGIEYYFKLTTRDTDGNESDGVITHIRLPETGLGLGLLVGASMGLAAIRRKKKK